MSSAETQTTDSANGTQDPYKMVDPNSSNMTTSDCGASDEATTSNAAAINGSDPT
jgi:hypothetical protein